MGVLTPEPPMRAPEMQAAPEDVSLASPPRFRWYHKFAGVMAAIFCFELGIVLLVFPWLDEWNINYMRFVPLWFRDVWLSPYFRGAVSGLGLLNIYISFHEVFRFRRFSE